MGNSPSRFPRFRRARQKGMVLLEGLIAILIFSLGILGMIGMQAVYIQHMSEARYRSEASLLTDTLIGGMRVSDRAPASLQASFNTGGAGYLTWKDKVAAALPGVAVHPPTVVVDGDGMATITVFWLAPSETETTPHQHVAIAQIR